MLWHICVAFPTLIRTKWQPTKSRKYRRSSKTDACSRKSCLVHLSTELRRSSQSSLRFYLLSQPFRWWQRMTTASLLRCLRHWKCKSSISIRLCSSKVTSQTMLTLLSLENVRSKSPSPTCSLAQCGQRQESWASLRPNLCLVSYHSCSRGRELRVSSHRTSVACLSYRMRPLEGTWRRYSWGNWA